MRIAIHVGTLRGYGSALVGRSVLQHMTRIGDRHRYLAWVPGEWRDQWGITRAALGGHVDVVWTRPGVIRKFATENVDMRRRLRRFGADVLLSMTDTSLPWCPVPHVLMVHQANLAYGPAERGFEVSRSVRLRWAVMERYLRATLPTVSALTVQTEDMRQRLCRRFGFPLARASVIPSAVPDRGVEDLDPTPVEGPPYLAYVASAAYHKNHVVLADLMAALAPRHPGLILRLTITPDALPGLTARARKLGVLDRFVFEGGVPLARALRLMRDAHVKVMPSKLESFGLPYYEAMALGTPLVVGDTDFAREACGSAAAYAAPDDGRGLAAAVTRLLDDDELRAERGRAARARFESVHRTWETVSARYLELVERAASEAG